jgi:hypothetical protein
VKYVQNMTALFRSSYSGFDLYSGCSPVEFLSVNRQSFLSISQVSQVSNRCHVSTLNWATTVSCHVLSISLFTVIQSFNSVYTELLASSFYKLEIHMAGLRYFWAQCKNKFVGPAYCQVSTDSSTGVKSGNEYREHLKHNQPFRPIPDPRRVGAPYSRVRLR